MRRSLAYMLSGICGGLLWTGIALGQDAATPPAAPAVEAPAAAPAPATPTPAVPETASEKPASEVAPAEKTTPKSIVRRLPTYFSLIINKQQRAEVYKIQDEYAKQIETLEAQLKALRKERDDRVMNVLTPDQKKEYEALKAKAKKSK